MIGPFLNSSRNTLDIFCSGSHHPIPVSCQSSSTLMCCWIKIDYWVKNIITDISRLLFFFFLFQQNFNYLLMLEIIIKSSLLDGLLKCSLPHSVFVLDLYIQSFVFPFIVWKLGSIVGSRYWLKKVDFFCQKSWSLKKIQFANGIIIQVVRTLNESQCKERIKNHIRQILWEYVKGWLVR